MKTFFPFIIVIILTVCSVSGNCSDSSKIFLKANHHLWMRTSYNNSSFKTLDYHFLFLPNTRKCALELDLYYYVESKKRFQRMLEEYSGKEQPFPYGLESLRAKLHLKDININNNWLKINKLTIGNFLQNRARYEYLNFSRYVLHSPLDIEQKRSLADWGFYSNVQMWKFNVEGFLLHSFKKDHTVGFQTNIEFSLSPKVTFIPILNGVFDSRTDENYHLQ